MRKTKTEYSIVTGSVAGTRNSGIQRLSFPDWLKNALERTKLTSCGTLLLKRCDSLCQSLTRQSAEEDGRSLQFKLTF